MTTWTSGEEPTATPLRPHRQLLTGAAGHLIEYFDWSAYSFLAIYFARQFFPGDESSVIPLLSTFAVFAVGFLTRPLGGWVMGRIADRHGRKLALTLSVAMMGVGSLLIGIAPTYAQVGIAAPIILILARLVQGLSTGGELATASAFLLESAPTGERGRYASFTNISSSLGKVICLGIVTGLGWALGSDAMAEWAWRVPFLVGALGAVLAWWIRRSATETHRNLDAPDAVELTLADLWRDHRGALVRAFGISTISAVALYTWTSYLPTWAVLTVDADKEQVIGISASAFVFYGAIQYPLGWLSDRIGRKPLLLCGAIGHIVCAVPLFAAVSADPMTLLSVQCAGMALTACTMSISGAALGEMFTPRVRVFATSVVMASATAIFGGTVPTIGTALHGSGHPQLFPVYLVVLNAIGLLLLLRMRETAHRPLPA